jgi:hypothetical protein
MALKNVEEALVERIQRSIAKELRRLSLASLGQILGDQILSDAAGAPVRAGNQVRLLVNAVENYPAWLAAMGEARRSMYGYGPSAILCARRPRD